jgi:DNA polymerase-3 subunit gamma/tau
MVARQAAGSMRDALTVLDQVVAFSGNVLDASEVARCLGVADRGLVFEIAGALLDANAAVCLNGVNGLAEQGLDMLHFARQLLELMRDLVVLRVAGADSALVELEGDERTQAQKIVDAHTPQEIERAFSGLSKLVDEVARSNSPKIVLEMGLVRLADRPPLQPIGELIAKLETIHGRLLGGTGSSRPGSGGFVNSSAKTPSQRENSTAAKQISSPPAKPSTPPRKRNSVPSASASVDRTERAVERNGAQSHSDLPETWQKIVGRLKEMRPALAAVLEHGVPLEISDERLKVAFREGSFFGRQVQDGDAQKEIVNAAEQVFGKPPRLDLVTVSDPENLGLSLVRTNNIKTEEAREKGMERARNHPRVQEALAVFPEAQDNVTIEVDIEEAMR